MLSSERYYQGVQMIQIEKRFQVFVSSTFRDLIEARQEIMQALLELDCIPAGMELFPAANDDQWTLIKKVIDDCDYYIVVIGGRYGSLGPDGKSYTQMEYEYAVQQRKPVIAFLHKDPTSLPATHVESHDQGRQKLAAFRTLAQTRMCKFWMSPADLGSVVSRSIVKLVKTHPGIGWVKADTIPESSNADEVLSLKRQIEELQLKILATDQAAAIKQSNLAQGSDPQLIEFHFDAFEKDSGKVSNHGAAKAYTWDEIFGGISPTLFEPCSDETLKIGVGNFILETAWKEVARLPYVQGKKLGEFTIDVASYDTIKVQLLVLGLIAKSAHQNHAGGASRLYYALTPAGEELMLQLRAVRKAAKPTVPTSFKAKAN